jgi:hypothetical protein
MLITLSELFLQFLERQGLLQTREGNLFNCIGFGDQLRLHLMLIKSWLEPIFIKRNFFLLFILFIIIIITIIIISTGVVVFIFRKFDMVLKRVFLVSLLRKFIHFLHRKRPHWIHILSFQVKIQLGQFFQSTPEKIIPTLESHLLLCFYLHWRSL